MADHRRAVIEREDVALFINAASTCTGQSEFYGDAATQRVSLSFLHDYVFGNYRRLYALCLAAGVNHYNQATIVARLLSAGAPTAPAERVEEGALIAGALSSMPPQRVYRLFASLRRARVNNRRTRAVVKRWLAARDLPFDALKYRGHLRSCARHVHLSAHADLHGFLFEGPHSQQTWSVPLLESFRRARYEQRALYELPFTVAEGLAAARGIDRATFLERIAPNLTRGERARVQAEASRRGADVDAGDPSRLPLTRLCTLALARPVSERSELREPLASAAARAARRGAAAYGRVHAVLDASFSTRAGAQKRNRTLAVTLGCSRLLAAASSEYRAHWTTGVGDDLSVTPRGQTDLATPLLDALRARPDLVVVVSDGFENDPVGGAAEVLRLFRAHVDPEGQTTVVHVNPVFDADRYMPRPLGPAVPTVGIRDASELPLKLAFARFASGDRPVAELEDWLLQRARPWLEAACD
ncbi:MAG: hypothetical protein KTR31_23615 [Myxococcales bacterium]|nr:hypothetical protein [Myxococcales bacterium]